MSEAPRRLWDSPWIRRLPLLVIAAVGIVFFLPRMPHDVDLELHLGAAANGLQSIDVEVLEGGKVLHRTVASGDQAQHLVVHLKLPKGDYRVEAKLEYAQSVARRASSFHVEDAGLVEVDLSAG